MKVIVFFTYGISLKDWENSGLIDREVRFYNNLINQYGIDITFVTYGDSSDHNYTDLIPNIKVVPVYEFTNKHKNSFSRLLNSFFLRKVIINNCNISNAIFKTNQLWGSWLPLLLKVKYKNPFMVRTGYDLLTFKKKENKNYIKIFIYEMLTKISLKYSDIYLVTSEKDQNFLQVTFPKHAKKIKISRNWIDTEKFKSTDFKNKNGIISVGRLERQKNYSYLINSFSNSNYVIDIVGDGSLRHKLQSEISQKNSKINLIGQINNNDLLKMLDTYKYFISSTLYEGNPKAMLEAMSSGCVVVAPNVEGVNEIINGENGLLYDFEKDNLQNIIEDLENRNLESISKNAITFINDNYSLENALEREVGFYQDFLN